MPELRLQFDPTNPGHFYACCGVIELLHLAGIDAHSQFYRDTRRPHLAQLSLLTSSAESLEHLVQAIKSAQFTPLARPTTDDVPDKDPIAPIEAVVFGRQIILDWWLDVFYTKPTPLKCWAGQVTSRKLFSEIQVLLPSIDVSLDSDGFTSTRFGVDPRSAWVALDLGYSPNEQGQRSRTFPVVEMLAAFGLQTFRPAGGRAQGFTYSLWHSPLPSVVARVASTKPWNGLAATEYKFEVGVRGSYKVFCFAKLNSD